MNKEQLQNYVGVESLSVIEAMKLIDQNAKGIIYIIDMNGHLIGSLTDGDIRRWILRTGSLSGTVSQMVCKKTRYLFETEAEKYLEFMNIELINSVPIVDSEFKLIDIYFRNDNAGEQRRIENLAALENPVIIMAGGKGMRLRPYTKILPKPLIPIGDIPIIERILNRFYQYGIAEFFITLNYKKEMIKSYFAELAPPYKMNYVEENIPLGTAGSIRLINKKFDRPVIITNCDILIEADYKMMMDYHIESGNDITVVSSLKNTIIPYGVIHSKEKGIITSMEEKPQLSYFVNTGMYIVNPECLNVIPANRVFHMTDLVGKMMNDRKQVGMYPVSENSFLDMGVFEEMKKMEEKINREDLT